jgi:outer membrane protein
MRSTQVLAIACLALVAPAAYAQVEQALIEPGQEVETRLAENYDLLAPDGLSLGVAAISSKGILLGENHRTTVVPVLGYEGERFFFRGISGGVHLFKRNGFELDLLVGARLDGWDNADLDAMRLAERGIDRAALRDRARGVDMGLGLAWKGSAGRAWLDAKTDVTNASGGQEVELGYAFAVPAGKGLLAPSVTVSYWSSKLSNYYYGVLPREEAAGVPRYRPGDAVVPAFSVAYLHALPGRWRVFGVVEYQWLPGTITDSPLVEGRRGIPSLFLGVSRSFGGAR